MAPLAGAVRRCQRPHRHLLPSPSAGAGVVEKRTNWEIWPAREGADSEWMGDCGGIELHNRSYGNILVILLRISWRQAARDSPPDSAPTPRGCRCFDLYQQR